MSEIPTWPKVNNPFGSTTSQFGALDWANLISDYYNGIDISLIDASKAPVIGTVTKYKPEKLAFYDVDSSHYVTFSVDDIDTGVNRKIKFRRMNTPYEEDYAVLEQLAQEIFHKTINSDNNTITNIKNTDIKTGAAIAVSKLAAGTETHVLTTVTGVPTWAAPGTGGITASSVDTFTNKTFNADATGNVISNIENADIKAAAGIVTTKLADSTNFVLTTRANAFGDFDNTFKDNRLLINNPADTFAYTIIGAAIAANRSLTLPLLTGNDTAVAEAHIQTLTNKIIQGLKVNSTTKTATYTATSTDDIILCAPAADMTINLPSASTSAGVILMIIKTNNNNFTVTVDGAGSETISGFPTKILITQYQSVNVYCDGTAWFINSQEASPMEIIRRWVKIESDFVGSTSSTDPYDDFPSGAGAGVVPITGDATTHGVYRLGTGTTTTGKSALESNTLGFVSAAGQLTFLARIRIPTLSVLAQRYIIRIGFQDNSAAVPSNGIFFEYDEATSANWRIGVRNATAGATTSSNSAVPTNTWQWLKIVLNAAGNSVAFYIDNVALNVSPLTSNIPTGGNSYGVVATIIKSLGTTSREFDLDYMGAFLEFTTKRTGF